MAALLKVKIITPKEVAYDGMALAVTIPAEQGEMQVYQGHIPVLARVIKGIVRIENSGAAPVCFSVDEGFFRVTQDEVSLLIDSIQPMQAVNA
ncbi:MAG: F0F1 ATP synthase subunit epsilon [Verrucomicrobia bacterium]|nr:F0F1 ATP synthase subunit epsilon [Verrucomicrobiota bacterium]